MVRARTPLLLLVTAFVLTGCEETRGSCVQPAAPPHANYDYFYLNATQSVCATGTFTKETAAQGLLRAKGMGYSLDPKDSVEEAVKKGTFLIMTRPLAK